MQCRRHQFPLAFADELVKLDQLKASGSITEEEYKKLRAKLI